MPARRYDECGVLIDPWPVDSYAYDAGACVGGYNSTDRTRHGPQLSTWEPFCCTTSQLVPESMGKMRKKPKIARYAGCEHNRDAARAEP